LSDILLSEGRYWCRLFYLLTYDIVSQRGVVFFRNQTIDTDDQKVLGQRLGELTGKPETSKVTQNTQSSFKVNTWLTRIQLHRHAVSNSKRGIAVDENGKLDDEISVISSEVS
jgi:hypothetical protein